MELLAASIIPLLFLALWLLTCHTASNLPQLRGKRICLLIAHPDDEAMFFSPTLLALTKPELENHVKILCLSEGDADGLGSTRHSELLSSASLLGIRTPSSDVLVLDSPDFPDSMTASWPSEKITETLKNAFNTTTRSSSIDALITFDKSGISGHPNHISLFHGVKAWLKEITKDTAGHKTPVALYTLTSIPIWRKYISVIDAPYTLFKGVIINILDTRRNKRAQRGEKGPVPNKMLFVSTPWDVSTGQKAMVKGHKSQMRWFRWGWISIGRYMVVNDLRKEG